MILSLPVFLIIALIMARLRKVSSDNKKKDIELEIALKTTGQWSKMIAGYEIKDKIGQGEFGVCHKAIDKKTQEVRCFKITDIGNMKGR